MVNDERHRERVPSNPQRASDDVAAKVAAVRARISAAAARVGRAPDDVLLVAAAKTKSAAMVEAALAAGITDVGENYVQEAAAKRGAVRQPARWHLIGHLQRNKAARAVEIFDVIQTVDTLALASVLAQYGKRRSAPVPVLIEVNVAGEQTKSGVAPAALLDFVTAAQRLDGLRVEGLMAIPPPAPPEATRHYFRRLRELRDAAGVGELSMGMTDDFEIAIEEGASIVRVGRAIFGER